MKKSTVKIAQNLNNQLMKVHDLANLLEIKNSQGILNFRNWLYETEEIMKKFNLSQVSQLAAVRTQLANYLPKNNHQNKNELFNNAATLLTQAQDDVWQTNAVFVKKMERAKELISQLLNLVYKSNFFVFDTNQDFTTFIENIWCFCNTHEQLKSITVQILSLINKSDVLLIIANEIDLEEVKE